MQINKNKNIENSSNSTDTESIIFKIIHICIYEHIRLNKKWSIFIKIVLLSALLLKNMS